MLSARASAAPDLAARWEQLRAGTASIAVAALEDEAGPETMLNRADVQAPLTDALGFTAQFERNWTVGSFTSLARQTSAAPIAGTKVSQRQPSTPSTSPGISFQASTATRGADRNWMEVLTAKARPRRCLGISSAR